MGTFSVTCEGVSTKDGHMTVFYVVQFLSCIKKITELNTGHLLKILPRKRGLNKASAPIPNEITITCSLGGTFKA